MNENVLQTIRAGMDTFSKGQKRIAAFILDNYDRAAFMTAARLGETASVSESTVVRFAAQLGYDGYPEMQKALQELIRGKLTSIQRIQVSRDQMSGADILGSVMQRDMNSIHNVIEQLDRDAFSRAVDKLLGAEHIYILGVRSSSFLAGYLNFYLHLIFKNVTLVQSSAAGEIYEQLAHIGRGDVLVELSNPSLTLEILNSEAELAEKQNLLRNTLISMEQEKLTLRQNKAQLDLDVARKRRAFEQNDELYAHRLIAREEWLQAKEDWELAEKQRELNIERQVQDSLYRSVQIERMEENLDNMKRNMQLIRQRIGNLAVKSPIDGEIGLLDVVLGQSVASGQKIGQVNDLSDFKVEAQIDEIYIDRVRTGLEASFERQDSNYRMRLRKVYPEVRNNVFRADFNFTGAYPANIRSGQTYYLHLQLGQPTEAVLVPRGTFYQTTGGAWIYVLSPEGDRAYKRPIRIGRQNPQYYEVLEGLQPGERVIVSGYESYGANDVLLLNRRIK